MSTESDSNAQAKPSRSFVCINVRMLKLTSLNRMRGWRKMCCDSTYFHDRREDGSIGEQITTDAEIRAFP